MSTRLPLQAGYVLQGYTIGQVLGGGGFAVVYLASSELSRSKVVIKEYCPQNLVIREAGGALRTTPLAQSGYKKGLESFRTEAERMMNIRHPNLIGVETYFEANNTLYMVMRHEEGRDLGWFISRMAKNIDWGFLQQVFPPIGDGLWLMHQKGVIHLDIKPANILLRTNGQPLLLDFGAAQSLEEEKPFGEFQTLTHGFAPPEQYLDDELGTWTDIYGLAATIYNCITGSPPPPALRRHEGQAIEKITVTRINDYPYTLLKTIETALSIEKDNRPSDMRAFISLAFGGAAAPGGN